MNTHPQASPAKRRYAILIAALLAVALAIRLAYLFSAPPPVGFDNREYDNFALSFLSGNGWTDTDYPHRAPLYPLFLAALYGIFGHSYAWVRIIQSLGGVFACALIFDIARRLGGRRAGLIALVTSVFYYGLIQACEIGSESLFIVLLALGAWLLVRWEEDGKGKWLAVAGFVFGCATLARSNTLVLPFFMTLWLWARHSFSRRFLRPTILFVAAFILPIAPWTARNYAVYDGLVPVNIQAGFLFWIENHHTTPWHQGRFSVDVPALPPDILPDAPLSPTEKDKLYWEAGWREVGKLNTWQLLRMEALKVWGLLFPSINTYDFSFVIAFPFFLYGLTLRLERGSWLHALFAALMVGILVFYGIPRFRAPFSPFIIVLAAIGCERLLRNHGAQRVTRYALPWIALNLAVFALETGGMDLGLF